MRTLHYQQYTLNIFGADTGNDSQPQNSRPVIWIPAPEQQGPAVWQALNSLSADASGQSLCIVICITGIDWNHDLSPWAAPGFGGGACDFLRLLERELLPLAEGTLPFRVTDRGIAGYSLAGLFAVYTMFQSNLFHRIGSVSGSLWFDGFNDYALTHSAAVPAPFIYVSLGSREHRTPNARMRPVRDCTLQFVSHWQPQSVLRFETNPGGHFKNVTGRMARAVQSLIELPGP